jgi:hypothetical protein
VLKPVKRKSETGFEAGPEAMLIGSIGTPKPTSGLPGSHRRMILPMMIDAS